MARNILLRNLATLTRRIQPVSYTPEGAVVISYPTLISSPLSLTPSIEEAFGSHPKSLGIIIVRDLPPSYSEYRERLLKLAYKFATLDENLLKGSYYANPVVESPTVSREEQSLHPEYYGKNIWPQRDTQEVEGFEDAFKNLGRLVFKVGCELAVACQPFALSHLSDSSMSLPDLIRTSQTTKARLLHYFPPSPGAATPAIDEPVDSWCGFHLDHSLLTGLCSAMFLHTGDGPEPTAIPSPSPASGLYIRTRGGDLTKVSIPTDALAFQTGEALEIATGGKLRATPHCVRVGTGEAAEKISRETFALFMQPNTDQHLSASTTFGQFSKRVFDEHYSEVST
ncbi:Clavaminate synthase-like protein [Infundibulicybe gibba]|nr:Clavaminate synthase-like protein [Infundibulicybe gibba]